MKSVGKQTAQASGAYAGQSGQTQKANEKRPLEDASMGVDMPPDKQDEALVLNPYRCYCREGQLCPMHAILSLLPESRH
jgi:hypothetical protein